MDNPWVAIVMVVGVGIKDCFDYPNLFWLMDEMYSTERLHSL